MAGLALSGLASAAPPPAAMIPGVLDGIKPTAAGECRREEAIRSAAEPPAQAAVIEPDLSCAITVAELSRLRKSPATLLVDVRTPAEFAQFHIDGSLNLTAAELLGKDYLRSKTTVLISRGKAEAEDYRACRRLKATGYKQVKVLRGGMAAWLAAGQAVSGRAVPSAASLARLTPAELWVESRFNRNLILVPEQRSDLRQQLPGAVPIAGMGGDALRAALARRKLPGGGRPSAVILVAAGLDDAAIGQATRAIHPVPLLVYGGTAEAFAQQISQQQAVWAAQARGPKQPPGCGH